jgi:nitrogen fixation protein FixH
MSMRQSNRDSTGGGPREITGRMVLACLVAFFAVVAGVNAIMVTAAVSTFGGVETVNAYQAGLAFAREEEAAQAQEARHWRVSAKLHPGSNGATVVEIVGRDRSDQPLAGLAASVALTHPTDRRLDHSVDMQPAAPGRFQGTVAPQPGQWNLVIELTRGGERLFRSRERIVLR